MQLSHFTLLASLLAGSVVSEKCPVVKDNCGGVTVPENRNLTQEVNFYSEPNFKGDTSKASINGLFGCTNLLPGFKIRSMKSTASTMMVLHYGDDCSGHVVAEKGTNFFDMKPEEGCAKSVFIKFHRHGSC